MPYKVWAIGEEVLSADFNPYVQQQVVATFASTAARDAAIPAPVVGQCCHVTTLGLMIWNGSAWAMQDAHVLVYNGTIPAAWGPLVGTAAATLANIAIPAQARAYYLTASFCLTGVNDVSADRFVARLLFDGVVQGSVVNRHAGGTSVEMNYSVPACQAQLVAAGVAKNVSCQIQRVAGTGQLSGSGSAQPGISAQVAFAT